MKVPQILYCGYMVKERDNALIYRPNGGGNYLFLYFPLGMYLTLNGEEHFLSPGACIFYSPKDFQKFRGIPAFLNSYIHFESCRDWLNTLGLPSSLPFYPDDGEELNGLIREIQAETLNKRPFSKEVAELALQKLLYRAARSFHHEQEAQNDSNQLLLEQIRLEMLTNCSRRWNVEELAAKASMSRSRFYDCYQRYFHTSPKAELLEARMDKARLLLTNNAITVRQAAEECGFENLCHFTRYYKKYYGHSPRTSKPVKAI